MVLHASDSTPLEALRSRAAGEEVAAKVASVHKLNMCLGEAPPPQISKRFSCILPCLSDNSGAVLWCSSVQLDTFSKVVMRYIVNVVAVNNLHNLPPWGYSRWTLVMLVPAAFAMLAARGLATLPLAPRKSPSNTCTAVVAAGQKKQQRRNLDEILSSRLITTQHI